MLTEAEKLWREVLDAVRPHISSQNYETWLEPTHAESISQNTLWVRVPNSFFIDWIEERYHNIIYEALKQVQQENLTIKYKVVSTTGVVKESKDRGGTPVMLYQPDSAHLQSKYTFESFIVGESNKFARAAAYAVATKPGKQYNPLFIYGGVGLGKTHLLQAIGNYIKREFADLKVYYIRCEEMMNEMIEAIGTHRMTQFKAKYRKKDALLIDDVQFLEGKESFQDEIFHTFNALYEDSKQLAFSADRPPSALVTVEERLISRFRGGLVCDIKPPSLETRIAILRKRAEASKMNVPEEIILFIANEIKDNIRDLEGALVKVFAHTSFNNEKIELAKVKELLTDLISRNKTELTVEKIQKLVADYYRISLASMRGKRRMKVVVLPRDVAVYIAREYTGSSLKEIGNLFGGRDHATIIHSYNKIKKEMEKNKEFNEDVNNIIKLIKGE